MQLTLSGASAAPGNLSSTITIVASSSASTTFQLVIPSLNINVSETFESIFGDPLFFGLSYVTLGLWQQVDAGNLLTSVTALAFGYETPANGMPTTGTADYSGVGTVHGLVISPYAAGIRPTAFTVPISGDAHLSANFSTGAITGGFTNMQAVDPCFGPTDWNDVSVNASIAAGTNKFSGSTAVTSQGSTLPFSHSLKGSATGHIDGAFYGPSAQNLGAIWSLSDGTSAAIGGVAAAR